MCSRRYTLEIQWHSNGLSLIPASLLGFRHYKLPESISHLESVGCQVRSGALRLVEIFVGHIVIGNIYFSVTYITNENIRHRVLASGQKHAQRHKHQSFHGGYAGVRVPVSEPPCYHVSGQCLWSDTLHFIRVFMPWGTRRGGFNPCKHNPAIQPCTQLSHHCRSASWPNSFASFSASPMSFHSSPLSCSPARVSCETNFAANRLRHRPAPCGGRAREERRICGRRQVAPNV